MAKKCITENDRPYLSIVIPCRNEAGNLTALSGLLSQFQHNCAHRIEIIFVDDGSTDDTYKILVGLAKHNISTIVLTLDLHHGQSVALQAGFDQASGDVIATIDADLQNDPADIPIMLQELEKGYDLVFGWRKNRNDPFLSRKLPSLLANRLIAFITNFPAHDIGCGLRVMRREVLNDLVLIGDFHRYIPILAYWRGARCKEVVVRHHPRRNGKSKYGIDRAIKVLLDLMTVKFFITYMHNPMRFFGRYGLITILAGIVSGCIALGLKMTTNFDLTGNPLSLLAIFLVIIGVQFFFLGILGELCSRIYFEGTKKKPYIIRSTIDIEDANETNASSDAQL